MLVLHVRRPIGRRVAIVFPLASRPSLCAREPGPTCQLHAVAKGEFEAFARGQVRRAAELGRRLRIPEHAAEDLLQECLVRLWRERETIDRSRWEGWLWKALHFRRLKHLRSMRHAAKHRQSLLDAFGPAREGSRPDVEIYLAQCDRDLRALLDGLLPVRREVVRLYLLGELPLAEVAARLGMSENTAKDHWRLAQIDMRAAWDRERARERSTLGLASFFAEQRRES